MISKLTSYYDLYTQIPDNCLISFKNQVVMLKCILGMIYVYFEAGSHGGGS